MSVFKQIKRTLIEFLQIIFPFFMIVLLFSIVFLYLSNMNFEKTIAILFMFSYLLSGLSVLGIFSILLLSNFFPHYNKIFAILMYVCLFLLFISMINQQIQIIKLSSGVFSLKNFWLECKDPKGILENISCLTTGYMPTKQSSLVETVLIIYGFWLYGFVIPLIILYHVFEDFIEKSGVIGNHVYIEIISLGFALIAYRFFIITGLINFLTTGLVGVLLILANLWLFSSVVKKIPKYFSYVEKPKEKTHELEVSVRLALEKLKGLPLHQINEVFGEGIREDLKTLLEAKGKSEKFIPLVEELNLAKNKNDAIKAINAMIAEIS
ncbi:MAG: hypothetical protein QXF88_01185 [Candidatus Aenigmatarchaeota archaeon]